jgi:subtilisin family serine protease
VALLLGLSTAAEAADNKTAQSEKARYGDQQPLFGRVNVLEGWEITKGDPEVLVGVIDNGYDFFHPDLKGQLIPGYYYAGGFHTEFFAGNGHGTMISSIIVAKDDNAGMVGLAPHCKVLTASQGMIEHAPVRLRREYLHDHPQATSAEIQVEMQKHRDVMERFGQDWVRYQMLGAADAIRYLVDHGARVINYSSTLERSLCPFPDVWRNVEDAFAYAAQEDVVIVLAAGNNAAKWEGYPGNTDSMLVVGASLLDDTRWEQELEMMGTKIKQGSNYGNRLSVMAPVDNLMVCVPHEARCYDIKDGPMGPMKLEFRGLHQVHPNGATSSAVPVVSSLVALVLSVNPDLDAKSVVKIIKQGCDDMGEQGYDIYTGYGRVNFGKTLRLAKSYRRAT